MAALTWDQDGSRKYEAGNDHGVLYPRTGDGYGAGVAWNGLTGVTESPSGAEETALWADNIKYGSMRSAEEFGATIEAYTYPDEFAECDGSATPAKGIHIGQQPRKSFGFSYRTNVGNDESADYGYRLHLLYGCTVTPSEKAYTTINDSPDAITLSWELTTQQVPVPNYNPTSCLTLNSWELTPSQLKVIEAYLYGIDDASELGDNQSAYEEKPGPRLPMPSEVISIINGVQPIDGLDPKTPVQLAVTVSAASGTVLTKNVSTLQSSVSLSEGVPSGTITATLTDQSSAWTQFDDTNNTGHFLVLKATGDNGSTVKATITGGTKNKVKDDGSGNFVFLIESKSQTIMFEATKKDDASHTYTSAKKSYSTSGCTLS